MDLQRFVLLNVILVPAIVLAMRRYLESIPLLLYVVGVGYVTFASLISVVWVLSTVSADRDGA